MVKAFGEDARSFRLAHVKQALAAYLYTLRSEDSAFDRFYSGSDRATLSRLAERGLELFRGRAGGSECHRINETNAPFTDDDFHSIGVAAASEELADPVNRPIRLHGVRWIVLFDPNIAALGALREKLNWHSPLLNDAIRG